MVGKQIYFPGKVVLLFGLNIKIGFQSVFEIPFVVIAGIARKLCPDYISVMVAVISVPAAAQSECAFPFVPIQ